MKISVIPFYDHFLQNRLFQFDNIWTSHWQEGNVLLAQECARRGHQIGTWDKLPLEQADVVVFHDYPKSAEVLHQVAVRAARARKLLMLFETPLDNPHWFDRRNHALFDGVMTYNGSLQDNRKYFRLYLPIGMPPKNVPDLAFEQRRPVVMVNTNRYVGLRACQRPWQYVERIRHLRMAGWKSGLYRLWRSRRGDLNKARRMIARVAEKQCPDSVDVFGKGWEGRHSGWYYRFFPDPLYRLAQGPSEEDKLKLLGKYRFAIAYENYAGDCGYVSEKIFDSLYAGTVPVYYGDRNIGRYVSSKCFVDGRSFKNEATLLQFLVDCPKGQWLEFREAGRQYLASEDVKNFQPEYYVRNVLQTIESLCCGDSGNLDRTLSSCVQRVR